GYFSLEVIRCRPFYILGLINRPGPYAFVPGLTVVQAVALAGGVYRSPETMGAIMREKAALADATSRLAEAVARRAQLDQSRQSLNRQRAGLETLIALKHGDADNHKTELARLAQRIDAQTKIFGYMQKLHEERIVNQQRFLEAVIALDSLQRDKQSNSAGLSLANTDLEKARRDLALVTLD